MTDNLRELDKRIALKMGLEVISTQEEFDKTKGWHWEMGTPKKYITVLLWNDNYRSGMWGYSLIPSYSSDISAAMELFENLKHLEPCLEWNDEAHTWLASFHKHPANGSAEMPATAISLAFDAVGESK